MIRVLHVLNGLGTGGTEALIMNWYRNIDRTKIQFDFLVRSKEDNYLQEVRLLGADVYYTSEFPRHFIRNYKETKKILNMGKWDVIHIHANAAIYVSPLMLAKKAQIRKRIMHSHSVKAQKWIYSLFHYFNCLFLDKFSTDSLACSELAGKWMFKKNKFIVIKNAVEVSDYIFDVEIRKKVRDELGIENKFVIGHVGRFVKAKNHIFLLEILKEIKIYRNDACLLLVGDGELRKEIEHKSEIMGIKDLVLFLGSVNDVGEVLSAMDVFVLPSLYEGLGNVLVEAQINGLKCFTSQESLNKEVKIGKNIYGISLKRDAEQWAKIILKYSNTKSERYCNLNQISDCGYDIQSVVSTLEKLYLE